MVSSRVNFTLLQLHQLTSLLVFWRRKYSLIIGVTIHIVMPICVEGEIIDAYCGYQPI